MPIEESTVKIKRKIVTIDGEKCNGCGECVEACAEGAIELVNGKARLVAEHYCDGLAACLGECPQGAITMTEREAEAFDPEAVENHLARMGNHKSQTTNLQSSGEANLLQSTLTHWPVQIKLVPPTAPFLKNADLLVVSDCVPVAYPNFHEDLLKGRVVLMGCPKFDDIDEYVKKFTDIFRIASIKGVTIAIMEVPCCSKMPLIVQKGMELAGKSISTEVVVINARGAITRRRPLAA
jgi:Pyruvate/2-oxoacid:ferredoxin oxidoreductase delta subunit